MNVNLAKIVLRSFAALSVCGAMSACAYDPVTDTTSPLAAKIDSIVAEKTAYPRWQDFPAAPVNVPDAAYVRSSVQSLESSQDVLNQQVASIDWTLDESAEEYIASIRQRLAQDGVEAPTLSTPAEIEAFAASLRARAKAPPPIDRPLR